METPAEPRLRRLAAATWRIGRAALVTYLLFLLLVTLMEPWLVYPRPPVARGDWQPIGLDHEDVWFESADGTRLHGWFVPHPNPRRAVLYCHGNGEQVGDNAWLVALLRDELDAAVFIFDYRGYGHSAGRPHEAGCIADGLAAQRWLAERMNIAPDEVVLMGRSLGSAVAVAAAAEQGAGALVLENSFSSMVDVAAFHYPFLPIRLLMRNRYELIPRIEQYDGPLFQTHGTADTIIPFDLGRELFDASPSAVKEFLELAGHDHNDPPPRHYYRRLKNFLDRSTKPLELERPNSRPWGVLPTIRTSDPFLSPRHSGNGTVGTDQGELAGSNVGLACTSGPVGL